MGAMQHPGAHVFLKLMDDACLPAPCSGLELLSMTLLGTCTDQSKVKAYFTRAAHPGHSTPGLQPLPPEYPSADLECPPGAIADFDLPCPIGSWTHGF